MPDANFIKIENNFNGSSWDFLDPRNWFRKKYTKDNVNILFIDDMDMPVVDNLKKSGYKVKKVKDVKDTDDAEVKNAQIIFVDFDGVGKNFSLKHQGVGLANELKIKYGKKKFIVLYTAQKTLPADTVMQELFNSLDFRLPKDSDTSDFIELIRAALKKIR